MFTSVVALFTSIVLLGGGTPGRPLTENLSSATDAWRVVETGADVSHIIFGDSISSLGGQYAWRLRDHLEQKYGNSGSGYLGFDNQFSHDPDPDRLPNRHVGLQIVLLNPAWIESPTLIHEGPTGFGVRSPDGEFRRIGNIGGLDLSFYGPQATLHYIEEIGAGVICIDVNGLQYLVDADTNDPTPRLASFTFATGEPDPTILVNTQITLDGATELDPQWTQLNGLQTVTGTDGSAFNRLTQSWGPSLFLDLDQVVFQDAVATIGSELVIVMVDPGVGDGPDYGTNMRLFLDRIETALPNSGIILASHHHFNAGVEDDLTALVEIVDERGHGLVNLFDLHPGGFAELDALGFMADSVHMTADGATWFADYYFRLLNGDLVPQTYTAVTGLVLEESFGRLVIPDDYPFEIRSTSGDIEFELTFQTDEQGFVEFDMTLEGHVTHSNINQRIDLWDVPLGDWVVAIPNHTAPMQDQLSTYFNFDAMDHVDPNGQIRVRLVWDGVGVYATLLDYIAIVNLSDVGCPADLDHDDTVSTLDELILLGAWGPNPGHPADLDDDGVVGPLDLVILLSVWGDCP